jgi:hypothetical protein
MVWISLGMLPQTGFRMDGYTFERATAIAFRLRSYCINRLMNCDKDQEIRIPEA